MRNSFTGFVILAMALIGTASATENPAEPAKFHFSFKTPVSKEPRLRMFNFVATSPIKLTDEGVVLSIPKERPIAITYGVQARMTLKGDFDITLAYDQFAAEEPYPKYGGGVNITLELEREPPVGLAIGRHRRPEGDRFGVTDIKTKEDGKRVYNPRLIPAQHSFGQLRAIRKGDRIRMLTADGDGEFKEYRESPTGKEDVSLLQFICYRTDKGGSVSVRLKEVTIIADQIVLSPDVTRAMAEPTTVPTDSSESQPPTEKPRNRTILWVVLIGLVSIAIAVAVILIRRKGKSG